MNVSLRLGGGSAIDVAKCIRLYSRMQGDGAFGSFLYQPVVSNAIRLAVIPTTAGSGSEATKYAVIYYCGEKQSIVHDSCIPDAVFMDSSTLTALPPYQKKSSMLDALCHSIESFWSVNSTWESREYARKAVLLILENKERYLANEWAFNKKMLEAAYLAGKVIHIAQTTAAHAMSYKLTGLYHISHGHAVALCLKELWIWMTEHTNRCTDPRGKLYYMQMLEDLGKLMLCGDAAGGAAKFAAIVDGLELGVPVIREEDYKILRCSVNSVRLKNHPVSLSQDEIEKLYRNMCK